jgi:ArsR family transcriptional regulator, arsenate/arsenite/antimonite-responsive transcriptional repressor
VSTTTTTRIELPLVEIASPGLPCCAPITGAALTAEEAADLAAVLKAVADPARLRLLSLIQATAGGEACVCDLTAPVGLSQPTVSHHLKVLLDAGLVSREKRGAWAYYRAVPARLAELATALTGTRTT